MKFIKPYYHIYSGSIRISRFFACENSEYTREILKCLASEIILKYAGRICLPAFICDVVPDTLWDSGIEVVFYHANNPYQISVSDISEAVGNGGGAVLIVNYFGLLQPEREILEYCHDKACFLIIDNSQLFFRKRTLPFNNYAEIFSMRKFFYGGTGLIRCGSGYKFTNSTEPTNGIYSAQPDTIKRFFCRHTDINKLRNILKKRYDDCSDLFGPYLDEGFAVTHDIVPVGIPLKVKRWDGVDAFINDLDCYLWPHYSNRAPLNRRTLVFPIHSMNNRKKVKKVLDILNQYGVI